ncbi:MAG: hypothetical protein ABIS86_02840 [Streptosporangiaceae bacterium]
MGGEEKAEGREVDREIGDLIGRLSGEEDLDRETRGRLLGRLARLLAASGRQAGVRGLAGGRWLADVLMDVAPRIPIRDLETLRQHHPGMSMELIGDELVRNAVNATTAVGALGGALAAVEFAAPPLLLTAPAQVVAETLVVASIEVKMIAELHELHGIQVQGSLGQRTVVYLTSWAKQRGVNPLEGGPLSATMGAAAKAALRKRLLKTTGRHLATLGPFLTGAVAGGSLNRAATKKLSSVIREDLRRHTPPPQRLNPPLGPALPPPGPPPGG